jgi:NADH:ubiquinone oxidoreductase subunit F (NADH-binding)/NADH:ubiquinone oxidoreductase subunit E
MSEAALIPTKRRHPGQGRRKTRSAPKGRQLDHIALEGVQALLGDKPRDRDLLSEHLHLIQDALHCLPADYLTALAHEMRLSLSEVYEVASFYAHFDIIKEDDPALPNLTIRVCASLSCALSGGQALQNDLLAKYGSDVRVVPAPCMGRCDSAPVAEVGHRHVGPASVDAVDAVVQSGNFHPKPTLYQDLDAYCSDGGYSLLKSCLAGDKTATDVIAIMEDSSIRGLGGAGFPTGRKWGLVRAEAKPRYMAVNADEGEPGTFKDRTYLEQAPHRFLEGMLIAAWAVEAERIYIYLRDEYPHIRNILLTELSKLETAGLTRNTEIILRRGAGAYICGEESAMIESIEGKRGLPRNRPPFPAQVGLFGRPTLINNVETMFWIKDILGNGASWYESEGRPHFYSVSGRVVNPGIKLAPAGVTVRQLINDYCGGMTPGHTLKAYRPGGASGGILPGDKADLALDFGALDEYGCFIGSSAVVIFSEVDNIKDICANLIGFFEDESCGQCTPCRVGCEKMMKLIAAPSWDATLIGELSETMRDASICGLGQAAPNPVISALRFFAEEVK